MSTLRIVGDVIELNGVTVAQLLPNLKLSLRDKLTEVFDGIDEDASYIAQLEGRIAHLESHLAPSTQGERS